MLQGQLYAAAAAAACMLGHPHDEENLIKACHIIAIIVSLAPAPPSLANIIFHFIATINL